MPKSTESNPEVVEVLELNYATGFSIAELGQPRMPWLRSMSSSLINAQEDHEVLQIQCTRDVMGSDNCVAVRIDFGACDDYSQWSHLQRSLQAACGLNESDPSWVPGLPNDICISHENRGDYWDRNELIVVDSAGNLAMTLSDYVDDGGSVVFAEHSRTLSAVELQAVIRYHNDTLLRRIHHIQQDAKSNLQMKLGPASKLVTPDDLREAIKEATDLGVSGKVVADANDRLQRMLKGCPPSNGGALALVTCGQKQSCK